MADTKGKSLDENLFLVHNPLLDDPVDYLIPSLDLDIVLDVYLNEINKIVLFEKNFTNAWGIVEEKLAAAGGGGGEEVAAGGGGGEPSNPGQVNKKPRFGGKKTRKRRKNSRRKSRKSVSAKKKRTRKNKKRRFHKSRRISGGTITGVSNSQETRDKYKYNIRSYGDVMTSPYITSLRIGQDCGGNEGSLIGDIEELNNLNIMCGPGGDWRHFSPDNNPDNKWPSDILHSEFPRKFYVASFEDELFFSACKRYGFYDKIYDINNFPCKDMQAHSCKKIIDYLYWVDEIQSERTERTQKFLLTHCFCGMGRTSFMLLALKVYLVVKQCVTKHGKSGIILDIPSLFGIKTHLPITDYRQRKAAQLSIYDSLGAIWLLRNYSNNGYAPSVEFLNIFDKQKESMFVDLFCARLNRLSIAIMLIINEKHRSEHPSEIIKDCVTLKQERDYRKLIYKKTIHGSNKSNILQCNWSATYKFIGYLNPNSSIKQTIQEQIVRPGPGSLRVNKNITDRSCDREGDNWYLMGGCPVDHVEWFDLINPISSAAAASSTATDPTPSPAAEAAQAKAAAEAAEAKAAAEAAEAKAAADDDSALKPLTQPPAQVQGLWENTLGKIKYWLEKIYALVGEKRKP